MDIFEYNGKRYRMTYDLHTHTVFSHGKDTIESNVLVAREKGLKKIAITDHGPSHLTYSVARKDFPKMREEVDRFNELYDDIEILLGVEANIVNSKENKYIDVTEDEKKYFDFINAGYHFGVLKGYCIKNYLMKKLPFSKSSIDRQRYINTRMIINAIKNNDLKILTHPGDKAFVDMDKIAKVCEEYKVLMEINSAHTHMNVEEIKIASKYDIKFVISSDAHVASRVGDFRPGLLRAFEAGIDVDRIDNIEEVI